MQSPAVGSLPAPFRVLVYFLVTVPGPAALNWGVESGIVLGLCWTSRSFRGSEEAVMQWKPLIRQDDLPTGC